MSKHRRFEKRATKAPSLLPERREANLSSTKKIVFSLVGFVLLPILALLVIELLLRVAGYGHATSFFKPLRINDESYLVENDKFGLRFFPAELARSPAPILMPARKEEGVFRIFILGESAALGDPRPAYGPGRYLQALLQQRFPHQKFEIIAAAVTAINSHALLPIARECARQSGDVWILYLGNNEMVGPFGAATVFGSRAPPRWQVRLSLAVQKLRFGQLVMSLLRRVAGPDRRDPSWGGMRMFLNNQVPAGDPRRETVYRNFAVNLGDILKTAKACKAKVILNSIAVNLKDCAPFISVSESNAIAQSSRFDELLKASIEAVNATRPEQALTSLEQAVSLNPRNAEAEFRLGTVLLALTNSASARAHFSRACDLDALPFRADSEINSILRRAATNSGGSADRQFLDAAGYFADNSPGHVPGMELFHEHVHFNFDGGYLLARSWAEKIEHWLPEKARQEAQTLWASQADCERRLGLTDWNRYAIYEEMLQRLSQPPFINQLNHDNQLDHIRSLLKQARARMNPESARQARQVYVDAIALAPADHRLHENYAEFLEAVGRLEEAQTEWEAVAAIIPHHHVAFYHIGYLDLRRGKLDEADRMLNKVLGMRPDVAEAWLRLGQVYSLRGQEDKALEAYARERALAPGDQRVYYQIGRSYSKLNRRQEAIASFTEAIRINPAYWEARYALGEELAFAGNRVEAKRQFLEVIRLKPDYPMAHFNLAVALTQEKQLVLAAREFEETLRLDPSNKLAAKYLEEVRAGAERPGTIGSSER